MSDPLNAADLERLEVIRAIAAANIEGVTGIGIEEVARIASNVTWHDVDGVDGFVRLDWVDPMPAPEDLPGITADLADQVAKGAKRRDVEAWYAGAIAAGWSAELRDELDVVVYSPGYTLRIDDNARNEFDQLATKWTIKLLNGLDPSAVTTTIYGIDETSSSGNDGGHLVTVDIFLALIDAGGAYYESLLNLRESYLQAIEAGNISFTVGDPLPE